MPKGSTIQQVKLARAIKNYANTGVKVNKGTLLESVGYSSKVAKHKPSEILDSKGVKLALIAEGISLDNADNVVKSILNSPIVYEMVTPDNQLRAADYIAKRIGGYAPDKLEVKQVIARITFNKPK
jgi:hypothetical protein